MATQTETQVVPSSLDVQLPSVIKTPAQVATPSIPRNVETEFSYYLEPEDGIKIPIDISKNNRLHQKRNWHLTTVYDVRGSSVDHTLDKSGFQYVKHKSALTDFSDEAVVKDAYYAEAEALLKKITGATKVHVFNHLVRHTQTHYLYRKEDFNVEERVIKEKESGEKPLEQALQGPVRGVHIDQSEGEAPKTLEKLLPDEASTLLKSRYQIINVWRPIKTIHKDPIGVIDANTVRPEDLSLTTVILPDHTIEVVSVKAPGKDREDGGHKWYFMSHQTPEDVLMFKIFDSKTDGRARGAPHSSFEDREYGDMPPRESIEVRAMVFYEDDVE